MWDELGAPPLLRRILANAAVRSLLQSCDALQSARYGKRRVRFTIALKVHTYYTLLEMVVIVVIVSVEVDFFFLLRRRWRLLMS